MLEKLKSFSIKSFNYQYYNNESIIIWIVNSVVIYQLKECVVNIMLFNMIIWYNQIWKLIYDFITWSNSNIVNYALNYYVVQLCIDKV